MGDMLGITERRARMGKRPQTWSRLYSSLCSPWYSLSLSPRSGMPSGMAQMVENDLLLSVVEVVEVGMMILRHRTTMVTLQERQHEAVTPQLEVVEQDKSHGARASGLVLQEELRLGTWLGAGTKHDSQKLNIEVEDYSVELVIQEAAAGLEVTKMLEKVARGHTVLSHPLHLQAGIRARVSDPQPEGRSGDFPHVIARGCERRIYGK
jgi:hypothetical protein